MEFPSYKELGKKIAEEALDGYIYKGKTLREWVDILAQQPCEDCISRQAAKKALEDRFMELQKRHDDTRYETNYCLNTILELPSVTPKEKSEYEHDHEVVKAYNDGQAFILDKIRAEIEERVKINQNLNTDRANALCWCLDIIDKYRAESEEE